MFNPVILVQVRSDSYRLPNKAMLNISDNKKAIDIIIQRLLKNNDNIRKVICTTDRDVDTGLVNYIQNKYFGVEVFRGSYDNIVKRLYDASEGHDYIIRITGDDLLTDIDYMLTAFKKCASEKADYCYQRGLIRGCDCDVFYRPALKTILEQYTNERLEHVEFYIKNSKFKVVTIDIDQPYINHNITLTLDTQQDYKRLRSLAKIIKAKGHDIITIGIKQILECYNLISDIDLGSPLLTVYIPYKGYPLPWLKKCMQAIVKQNLPKDQFETIIYIYGLEHIEDVIKLSNAYGIRYFIDLECKSFLEAILGAIKQARGKYVLRADADDYLCESACKTLLEACTENDYGIVYPAHHIIDENEKIVKTVNGDINYLSCHCIIDKKIYGFIKYLEGQKYRDGISLIETAKKYNFETGFVDTPLFYHRIHKKQITADQEHNEKVDTYIRNYYVNNK